MKNLKAIIIFVLFWSIVIWCAKLMKRKQHKRLMEFSEKLPEMELVTDEEERKYIYKKMKETGKLGDIFFGLVFLFNWWGIVSMIVEMCQEWNQGIAEKLLAISFLLAVNYVLAESYRNTIERKHICESGVIKKKIVHIQSYEQFDYGWPEGVIEGKEKELRIDLSSGTKPFKQDGDMAMLVWLESGENSLLPRMKSKGESNTGE